MTLVEARSEYQRAQTIYQAAKEAAKKEIDDTIEGWIFIPRIQRIERKHFLPQYKLALEHAEDRLIDIICRQVMAGAEEIELDDLRIQTVRMKIIHLALED